MPSLTLNIVTAKVFRAFDPSADVSDKWHLELTAKLPDCHRFRLTTGEDEYLNDVIISVNFTTITAEERSCVFKEFSSTECSAHAVGVLKYYPSGNSGFRSVPATMVFGHFVTDAQMCDLIDFAKRGRYPSHLTVYVANNLGVKYGFEPDGSGMDWDTKANPSVPIEFVSCVFQIGSFVQHDKEG